MANENNDEFLGDLKENADAFTPNNSEDPFAPKEQEEPEIVETVVEEEKPLPFHKDPKVQRYIEREIAKRIPEKSEEVEREFSQSDSPYADILKDIIGDDTPEKRNAMDKFNRTFMEREEKIASRALESIQAE